MVCHICHMSHLNQLYISHTLLAVFSSMYLLIFSFCLLPKECYIPVNGVGLFAILLISLIDCSLELLIFVLKVYFLPGEYYAI